MVGLDRFASRIAVAAGVSLVALMTLTVPLKSAGADNDDWGHHQHWRGGSYGGVYIYGAPSYYYAPLPPVYYAPAPYYAPPVYYVPPRYYAPPPVYYGPPSVGLSVILPLYH